MKRQQNNGRVTLLSLARYLGLSRTTVSVVLSGSPSAQAIPHETQERIFQAAKDLGYRPNALARSLRQQKTHSIGILTPELGEGYFTLVMSGIERYLLDKHYFFFTASHGWDMELLRAYPRMLQERAVDGLLFINTPLPEDLYVPAVTISGHQRREGVTNVVVDHDLAIHLALGHLHELGHRKIAFMRGQAFTLDRDVRWNTILKQAREFNIEIDSDLCITLQDNTWSPELGYNPVRHLLARRKDFTAIFSFNDTAALGALRALGEAGLRVPADVSVIGFDDIVGAAYALPSLTTIRQPLAEMGRTAATILLEKIAGAGRAHPADVIVGPKLIVRESTARARARLNLASA